MKTRDIVLCGLFAALVAVGTFIKIPTPLLPITLQTLFVILAGLILGRKNGAISVSIYVIIGLLGVPVFTQGGGFSYILNPTFGYILSFIAGAWLSGFIAEKFKPSILTWTIAGIFSIILIYAIGIPYFYFISRYYMGNIIAARTLLVTFILMPLPGDLISCLAAALLVERLSKFFPEEFTWKRANENK